MKKARYPTVVSICLRTMFSCLLIAGSASLRDAEPTQAGLDGSAPLKHLSLAELGNVKVITASKEPEEVWKTPAAIYVITQEDIRHSGVTNIPDALHSWLNNDSFPPTASPKAAKITPNRPMISQAADPGTVSTVKRAAQKLPERRL